MDQEKPKKILFLITKSNWGEKCWEHFARLALLDCEYLEQTSERVDSICKMAPKPPHTNANICYAVKA